MKLNFTNAYEVFRSVMISARKQKKITQQDLATLLNKPQSFVSKYESGERRLDIVEFFYITKKMQLDPLALLQEMGFIPDEK